MKFGSIVLIAAAAGFAVAAPAKRVQGSEAMSLEQSLAKIPFLALMYVVHLREVYCC